MKNTQRGSAITWIILIVVIIILVVVCFIYFSKNYQVQSPAPEALIPVATTTTTTSTPSSIVPKTSIPAKTTPVVQQPVAKQPASTPKHIPVLTWQPAPYYAKALCYSASAGIPCSADKTTPDLIRNGSTLIGATEYCQYLDANGSTLDASPQNLWRLPTSGELYGINQNMIYALYKAFGNQSEFWSTDTFTNTSGVQRIRTLLITGPSATFKSSSGAIDHLHFVCMRYI
jgi:hypothetical protein